LTVGVTKSGLERKRPAEGQRRVCLAVDEFVAGDVQAVGEPGGGGFHQHSEQRHLSEAEGVRRWKRLPAQGSREVFFGDLREVVQRVSVVGVE